MEEEISLVVMQSFCIWNAIIDVGWGDIPKVGCLRGEPLDVLPHIPHYSVLFCLSHEIHEIHLIIAICYYIFRRSRIFMQQTLPEYGNATSARRGVGGVCPYKGRVASDD